MLNEAAWFGHVFSQTHEKVAELDDEDFGLNSLVSSLFARSLARMKLKLLMLNGHFKTSAVTWVIRLDF